MQFAAITEEDNMLGILKQAGTLIHPSAPQFTVKGPVVELTDMKRDQLDKVSMDVL